MVPVESLPSRIARRQFSDGRNRQEKRKKRKQKSKTGIYTFILSFLLPFIISSLFLSLVRGRSARRIFFLSKSSSFKRSDKGEREIERERENTEGSLRVLSLSLSQGRAGNKNYQILSLRIAPPLSPPPLPPLSPRQLGQLMWDDSAPPRRSPIRRTPRAQESALSPLSSLTGARLSSARLG